MAQNASKLKNHATMKLSHSHHLKIAQSDLITIAPTEIVLLTLIDQPKLQYQKLFRVVRDNLIKVRVLLAAKRLSSSAMTVKLNLPEIKSLLIKPTSHLHLLLKNLISFLHHVNGKRLRMVQIVSKFKAHA